MDYQQMLELASSRRSIRKFSDQNISREDIEKIVNVAMLAPSGANLQPWEFIVVDDKVLRDQINDRLLDAIGDAKTAKGFKSAPVHILVYGDTRVRPYGPPAKVDNDQWWDFTLNASLNNALMTMQYAATTLGLGSMWVSAFRNPKVSKPVQDLLNIPSHFKIYEMLSLGYPDVRIGKKKMRRISDVVHYNVDNNYRSDEDVVEWFSSKRAK